MSKLLKKVSALTLAFLIAFTGLPGIGLSKLMQETRRKVTAANGLRELLLKTVRTGSMHIPVRK